MLQLLECLTSRSAAEIRINHDNDGKIRHMKEGARWRKVQGGRHGRLAEVDGACCGRHVDRRTGIRRSVYERRGSSKARFSERQFYGGSGRPRLEGARRRRRLLLLRSCRRQAPL